MIDSVSNPTPPRDATEVQLRLRSLLIITAVVAVVASALGAFIRHFPKDVQLALAVYWGILAAILVSLFAFNVRRRYLAEKKAGHVRFQVARHNYFLPRAPEFSAYFVGTLSLMAGPGMWIGGSYAIASDPARWWETLNYGTVVCVLVSGAGITYFWWRRIRLAENGLVVRHQFIPWNECFRWYWDACNKNVAVIAVPRGSAVAVKVPADDRTAVESLLKEKIKPKDSAKNGC